LTEILPGLVRIGVINPRGAGMPFLAPEAKAAQTLGLELKYFEMANLETRTVDAVIRQAREQVQAAVVNETTRLHHAPADICSLPTGVGQRSQFDSEIRRDAAALTLPPGLRTVLYVGMRNGSIQNNI
jgi:hypothetical protein